MVVLTAEELRRRRDPPSKICDAEAAARVTKVGEQRYRIDPARRGGVLGKRTLLPGEWVTVDDFEGRQATPAQPAQPPTLNYDGTARAGVPELPARPCITGEDVLQSLLLRDVVIDTQAAERQAP